MEVKKKVDAEINEEVSAFSKIRDKKRLIWKRKKEGKIVNK